MFRLRKNFFVKGPSPPRIARNCYGYAAGGMPLAFTQEDFLVVRIYFINRHEMREAALSDMISSGKLHRRNRHDRSVKLISPLGKFSYDLSFYRAKTVLGKCFSFQSDSTLTFRTAFYSCESGHFQVHVQLF